jgi:carbonic anhydrase
MSVTTTDRGIIQPADTHDISRHVRPRVARNRARDTIGASLLLALLLAGCHKPPAPAVSHAGDAAHATHAAHGASGPQAHAGASGHDSHWTYDGATGPEAWANLDPGFATCSRGTHQSPVDLPATVPAASDHHIEFHYQSVPLKVANNGHTIQVDVPAGSYIELDGGRYDLLQFHFHHPSEETIAGEHTDMVVHLVHRSPHGALSVVGVLMKAGPGEPAILSRIWEHLPAHAGETDATDVQIALSELLPADHHFYHYTGSLTTPPCTEDVVWNVMAFPIDIATEHVQAFHALYPTNARPVQPLHDRAIGGGV